MPFILSRSQGFRFICSSPFLAYSIKLPANERSRIGLLLTTFDLEPTGPQTVTVAQVIKESFLIIDVQAAQRMGAPEGPTSDVQMCFQMLPQFLFSRPRFTS